MTHFNWLDLLNFIPHHLVHVYTLLLTGFLLLCLGLIASYTRKKTVISHPSDPGSKIVVPASSFGLSGFFEIITEFIDDLVVKIIGKKATFLTPVFSAYFLIILFCNLTGLIPGMTPATDNLNTTLAMGFLSFLMYNFLGFKAHGISYLKQFLGPVGFLIPLMLLIEIISHVVRPLSLGLRLWGNIMGDHLVLGIFLDLGSYFLIPLLFYGLGLFVCFMQAFVFTILSIVYVSMAVSHDH